MNSRAAIPPDAACRVCRAVTLQEILHWPDVPTNAALFFSSAEAARAHPRASFRLVSCRNCGAMFNADADTSLTEYSERSCETQAWSPTFAAFARRLARRWTRTWQLEGATVLEIGCGRTADFLELLCSESGATGIGLDPVVDVTARPRLELHAERFMRTSPYSADAVVCRHTLEHISDVAGFLTEVRDWASDNANAVFLFEVPDAARILRENAFWDLYYEHCTYFTRCSLQAAFALAGFEIHALRRAFSGHYLVLEATLAPPEDDVVDLERCGTAVARAADAFGRSVRAASGSVRAALESMAVDGPLVLWQASSKVTGLLTATAGAELVTALVDVNPEKHGTHLVGSGLEVLSPSALPELAPTHVVLMNATYRTEVERMLLSLGVEATLHTADELLHG